MTFSEKMLPKLVGRTRQLTVLFVIGTALLTLVYIIGIAIFASDQLILWSMRNVDDYLNETCINHHVNNSTLRHQDLCCKVNFLLAVIVVTSSTSNFQQRAVVRSTWGTISRREDIVLVFLLGQTNNSTVQQKILEEDAVFGDIIQGEFLDTYLNLTMKGIEMLRWVNTYCSNSHFMFKIDDDVFLNSANFLKYIQELHDSGESKALIVGRLGKGYKPVRSKKSRYYVSEQEYAQSLYPDFVHGPSYLYTKEAVPLIISAATQLVKSKSYIHLEDVFLNGICAEKTNVTLVNLNSITVFGLNDVCTAHHSITIHEIGISQMYFLWWLVHDPHFKKCQNIFTIEDNIFFKILRGKPYSLS